MSYWIKCPLDIKEKIQQYLKYNMMKEFEKYINKCSKCNCSIFHEKYSIIHYFYETHKLFYKIYNATNKIYICEYCYFNFRHIKYKIDKNGYYKE